jgi:hypothetical protein
MVEVAPAIPLPPSVTMGRTWTIVMIVVFREAHCAITYIHSSFWRTDEGRGVRLAEGIKG